MKTLKVIFKGLLSALSYLVQDRPFSEKIKDQLKDGQVYWNYKYKNKVKVHQDIRGIFFITFEVLEKGVYITKYRGLDDSIIRQLTAYKKQDLQYRHNVNWKSQDSDL